MNKDQRRALVSVAARTCLEDTWDDLTEKIPERTLAVILEAAKKALARAPNWIAKNMAVLRQSLSTGAHFPEDQAKAAQFFLDRMTPAEMAAIVAKALTEIPLDSEIEEAKRDSQ